MTEPSMGTTRNGFRFAVSGSSLLVGLVLGVAVTSVYFTGRIKAAEDQHRIDTNRAMARTLMWDASDNRLKYMPIQAFEAWFPFAKTVPDQHGRRRYHWMNYTAVSDGDNPRYGRPNRQTGEAWLIFGDSGTVVEVGYASCD
jgi:hypothetical protein